MRTAAVIPVAIAALLATSALDVGEADAAQRFPLLNRAQSCDALRDAIAEVVADQAQRRNYWRYRRHRHRLRRPMLRRGGRAKARSSAPRKSGRMSDSAAPSVGAEAGGKGGPSHFTRTNNQVAGVAEADRVKTDGRYLYTIAGNELLILKSWPATSTSVVARYKAGSGETPHTLLLRGDKLVLISRHYRRRPRSNTRRYRPSVQGMRLTVLDIRNRSNPQALAHVDFEGRLLAARRMGKEMYLVTSGAVQVPRTIWSELQKPVYPKPQGPKRHYFYGQGQHAKRPAPPSRQPTYAELRQRARRLLKRTPMTQLLPAATFLDASGRAVATRSMQRCGDVYIPADGGSLGLISVTRLNLAGGAVASTSVLASGYKVYTSKKAVYVAGTSRAVRRWRGRFWRGRRVRRWSYRGTVIHKFALGAQPRYAASGGVPGYLLNQFSMDEHRGYLRVATTQRGWGWRRGARGGNGLFVLGQRGRRLSVVGSVQGLAPRERIYAARLMGDKGYIVTFRRTDPLYTLDLRNPREPKLMGELKINGFSSYIHPLGGGRLLTIGQDATSSGRIRGAHLQIFDVRNLKQPTRTHHLLLTPGDRSVSSAQYDHHAFTYDAKNGLLAVPLRASGRQRFTGVALVRVHKSKGFQSLGMVDHSDIGVPQGAIGWRCPPGARRCSLSMPKTPVRRRWVPIQRTVFIDRYMFTLSNIGVKVHDVGRAQPRRVASVHLAK